MYDPDLMRMTREEADASTVTINRSQPHILITGNPVQGFTAIGPFDTWDEAAIYGDEILAPTEPDYWLMPVKKPSTQDED